jgi:hypothetical protein
MSSTITQTQVSPSITLEASGRRMTVDGKDPVYGDWRDDLVRDGYAVIKGAVPKERAAKYADKMYSLAESL